MDKKVVLVKNRATSNWDMKNKETQLDELYLFVKPPVEKKTRWISKDKKKQWNQYSLYY